MSPFKMLLPNFKEECDEACKNSFAVHLWNEMFRRYCFPKNMLPPRGSYLFEKIVALIGENAPCMSVELIQRLIKGTTASLKLNNTKK